MQRGLNGPLWQTFSCTSWHKKPASSWSLELQDTYKCFVENSLVCISQYFSSRSSPWESCSLSLSPPSALITQRDPALLSHRCQLFHYFTKWCHLPSPARGRKLCVCRCFVDGASYLLKFNERVCVQPFKLLRSSKYNTCPKIAFKLCKQEFWRSFNLGNLRNTSWASICFWQMTRAGETLSFITCFKLFTCESFRGCETRRTWNVADYDAQLVVFQNQDSRLKCNGKSRD